MMGEAYEFFALYLAGPIVIAYCVGWLAGMVAFNIAIWLHS